MSIRLYAIVYIMFMLIGCLLIALGLLNTKGLTDTEWIISILFIARGVVLG